MSKQREDRLGEIGGYWLSQRGNSTAWCRTWFDSGTRQTRRASLGTDDLQQAKLRLAEWVVTYGAMAANRPEDVALETCLVRYYQQQGQNLRSAEQARYALKRWSDFFAGALVSEVTSDRVRRFAAAMRAEGLSDGYIRRTLAVGQAALNRAHREGELTAVPRVNLALAPEAEPRERLLTVAEAAALFDAAVEPHVFLYLLLAFGTAARPEAILELTSFQVDRPARLIHLNPAGRRQTKKRRPTVPICDALLPHLTSLSTGHVIAYRGRRLASIRMAFRRLTARAAKRIRRDGAERARRLRAAGARTAASETIDQARTAAAAILEVTPYTVRHTMASELRKRGVSVWEVAGLLGHSTGYKTTERYAKFGSDHLSECVRAIDGYFADLVAALTAAGRLSTANRLLRVSCVSVSGAESASKSAKPVICLVEPSGIEPLTSTMPL